MWPYLKKVQICFPCLPPPVSEDVKYPDKTRLLSNHGKTLAGILPHQTRLTRLWWAIWASIAGADCWTKLYWHVHLPLGWFIVLFQQNSSSASSDKFFLKPYTDWNTCVGHTVDCAHSFWAHLWILSQMNPYSGPLVRRSYLGQNDVFSFFHLICCRQFWQGF